MSNNQNNNLNVACGSNIVESVTARPSEMSSQSKPVGSTYEPWTEASSAPTPSFSLLAPPSRLLNKIRLITTTIDTVQHRLRREYLRCQLYKETHQQYDEMCIKFHQDAYDCIEKCIKYRLPRPVIYELQREEEEYAVLTVGHIRHVQKHFHRSFKMLLSIKDLAKSLSIKNGNFKERDFENMWYKLYHEHFDQNFAIQQFKLMAEKRRNFVQLIDACNNVDETGVPVIRINEQYPRRKLQLFAEPYPSYQQPYAYFADDQHICYINCTCDLYPEMQAITCDTISFHKKEKAKKPRKPTTEEVLLKRKVAKLADEAMRKCRMKRALREAFNDFDPPQMQADEIVQEVVTSIPSSSGSFVVEAMKDCKEDPAAVEKEKQLTAWQRLLNFFKDMGSSVFDFKTFMCSKATQFMDMMKDFANSIIELLLIKKAASIIKEYWKPIVNCLICIIIYLIGKTTDNDMLANILVCFYAGWVFSDKLVNIKDRFAKAIQSEQQVEMQAPGFSFLLTAITTVTALLFGQFTFLQDSEKYDKFITRLAKQANALNAITTLSGKFKSLLMWACEYFGLNVFGFAADLTSIVPKDVEHFLEEVRYFYNADVCNKFKDDPELCKRVEKLYNSLPCLLSRYNDVPNIRKYITEHVGFTTRVFQEANLANPSMVKPRVEPVTIFLRGAAGIGKTKLVYRLASLALMNSKKITANMDPDEQREVLTQNVYSRRIDNEFWDGYHGQEVTVVDDFGQAQDSVANPNKEYLEFIMCANSFPLPLHMANLSEKSKTFFTSSMYIATTNLKNLAPPSLTHVDALLRRIDFPLWVELKDQYKDSQGRFIKTEGLIENAHDFYTWDPKSGNKDPKKLSMDDVVNLIAAKYTSIREKAKEELSGTADFINKYKNIFPEQQAPSTSTQEESEDSDDSDDTVEENPQAKVVFPQSDKKTLFCQTCKKETIPVEDVEEITGVTQAKAEKMSYETRLQKIWKAGRIGTR